VLDPSTGKWQFKWGPNFDAPLPCDTGLSDVGEGGVIERAGLHVPSADAGGAGDSNVLMQCGDIVHPYTGPAASALNTANEVAIAAGWQGCVATVAPASLPFFSRPYGALADGGAPELLGAFDFDVLQQPWDVQSFGQAPSPPGTTACGVDRTGHEGCYLGTAAQCGDAGAGCRIDEGTPLGIGYTWGMPEGTPVLAVAAGIVRGSLEREVPGCAAGTTALQQEIYVEHAMGSNAPGLAPYTERFVAGYQGLSSREVPIGKIVARGEEIGQSGSGGCPSRPALRFIVLRLTNLTSAYAYTFETEPGDPSGFNGIQGAVDPFGWGAPEGVDPWAHDFTSDAAAPGSPCGYGIPGAFSIDLWLPGEAPPAVP
jgi:hypothetical protein